MANSVASIPVLECKNVGLEQTEERFSTDHMKVFGEQLVNALATYGFCYLKDHGLDKNLIERYLNESSKIFALPTDVKEKYKMKQGVAFGYVGNEMEQSNLERPSDLKEAFDYVSGHGRNAEDWPNEEFRTCKNDVFKTFTALSNRLIVCLSLGLGLDEGFMTNAHKLLGDIGNETTLRTLSYPPIADDVVIKPSQIRLGEHSDYGSFSFILQDEVGGLEAALPGGEFVPVTPIPDTLVLLVGDMMQRWTSDALKAPIHRVLLPDTESRKTKTRQSIVFFVFPDNEFEIKPLDGSNKYEPITYSAYIDHKLGTTIWYK